MVDHGNTGYSGRLIRAAARSQAQPTHVEKSDEAVVPASADPVQSEAEGILARAEVQARAIVQRGHEEAESLRSSIEQEAQRERERRLGEELITFSRKIRKQLDDIRPRLARMVVEAVEAIIGTLPEDEIAERMIRRALRDLDADTRITLYAARYDQPVLAQVVDAMAQAGEDSISIVEIDPDLESGTCRLEAGGISVEMGIRAQLDLLEELLLREEQVLGGQSRERLDTDPRASGGSHSTYRGEDV